MSYSEDELVKMSKGELIALIKQYELRAKKADAEKQSFIEASYDGFWDWDLENNREYMSPRFWEIFGIDYRTKKHDPEEWQDIIFQEDLNIALKNLKEHFATKGKHPYRQEVRYFHSDGSTVTVFCRGQVIEWTEDGRPKRMIGTHTDITVLKEALKKLESMSHFKSQFLANVSHELRSPLNCVLLVSKALLSNREKNLTEKQLEKIRVINEASNDLFVLTNDLLDLSKIEKGVIDIEIDKVQISDIANNISRIFKNQFEAKGVEFQCTLNFPNSATINTDKHRVEQIIRNLVSNALKFTEKSDLVAVTFEIKKLALYIEVKDSGIGMKEEDLDSIFDTFKQLNAGKKHKHQGTGLGLAISKNLADLLNGKIVVKSELGRGTTFTLVIPDSCS